MPYLFCEIVFLWNTSFHPLIYLKSTCPTNSEVPAVEASPAGAASSEAEPPVAAAASNAVVRTVTICQNKHMIILCQRLCFRCVPSLGPGTSGSWWRCQHTPSLQKSRCPVFKSSTPLLNDLKPNSATLMAIMSEMGETSSWAARRGRTEREKAEAPWWSRWDCCWLAVKNSQQWCVCIWTGSGRRQGGGWGAREGSRWRRGSQPARPEHQFAMQHDVKYVSLKYNVVSSNRSTLLGLPWYNHDWLMALF